MLSLGTKTEEELGRQIETYCKIARENGSILSVEDLSQLIPVDASINEIEQTLKASPVLSSSLLYTSGYVIRRSRSLELEQIQDAIIKEKEGRKRAIANILAANDFAKLLGDSATLVAVGGTNSYLSARKDDDIDFFCIARRDSVWILMLESLVKARLFRMARRETPELCFSFILDEGWVEREFKKEKDAIFARDVLTSKVMRGRMAYNDALLSASWMEGFYPRLYRERIASRVWADAQSCSPNDSAKGPNKTAAGLVGNRLRRIANSFLYATLGSYILLKARLLNRRFASEGRTESMFTTDKGKDHLIYESNKYRRIRRMYGPLHASSLN